MQAEWEPEELIGAWTLNGGDWDLIANKTGVTRLGFAVMLKFYEIEGRFPAYPQEVPPAAVSYLASLVKVDAALFAKYSWRGRTIEYHRAQIRRAYGTRPPTEDDEDRWARWLGRGVVPGTAALRRRCRSEKVEPPSTGQVERVVASGCWRFDDDFAATTAGRLGPVATHLGDQKVPLQLIMAKTRHKSPRTAMRYVKPGDAAVAEVTSLLGPPRRSH